MRAILLAAGLGTRLQPITNKIPKCLVEINGRPLLDYWLDLLSNPGISEILINLHYLPDMVVEYIKNCKYTKQITIVYENTLLGTGGTLLKNRAFYGQDPVMLIHADNLSLFDMRAFQDRFCSRDNGIDITMMTFQTDTPETCGIVELNELGAVSAFHEKVKTSPSSVANAAVYILAPVVTEFIESLGKEVVDFSTEVLPHFIGRINTFHNDIYHRDIGTMSSLSLAQNEYPLVANELKKI